jgi:hypothetical protein
MDYRILYRIGQPAMTLVIENRRMAKFVQPIIGHHDQSGLLVMPDSNNAVTFGNLFSVDPSLLFPYRFVPYTKFDNQL